MALTTKQQRQIDYYNQQFQADGTAHYLFACHAAFPVVFSVEMLHQLWANFKVIGEISIPKVVISDFLLSNLCQEVGLGLYEFRDKGIRTALLHDLEQQFDKQHRNRLAAFLFQYAEKHYNTTEYQNLKDTHQWTALATLNPQEAIQKIGDAISKSVVENDAAEKMRIHSLLEEIVEQQPVLEDLLEVIENVEKVIDGKEYVSTLSKKIGGDFLMEIKIPKTVNKKISLQTKINQLIDNVKTGKSKSIQLNRVGLNKIPNEIFDLSNLERLELFGNNISEIPIEITQLNSLKYLYLSVNPISEIPDYVFELESLEELRIADAKISIIPNTIGKAKGLKEVHLHENKITEIPLEIIQLKSLKHINLSHNNIEVIPFEVVMDLKELKYLTIHENPIINLPNDIKGIISIRNYITEVEKYPKFMNKFPALDIGTTVGKMNDLEKLHKNLQDKQQIKIINGKGGTGKTTLALMYCHYYEKYYDHFIWLNQHRTLEETILYDTELQFSLNLKYKDSSNLIVENTLAALEKIKGRNLLIIDDADNSITSFINLLPKKWKVIITSRINIELDLSQHNLSTLTFLEAKDLFKKYCSKFSFSDIEFEILYTELGYNTLALTLFAKISQEKSELKTITQLIQFLKENRIDTSYLSEAYILSDLSKVESWLLLQMSVLPLKSILINDFFLWLNIENSKEFEFAIDTLNKKGWIEKYNDTIRINRLIQDFILLKIEPNFEDCKELVNTFINFLFYNQAEDNPIDKFQWIEYGMFLCNQINDEVKEIAELNNWTAISLKNIGNYSKAIEYIETATKITDTLNDKNLLISYNNNLANIYKGLGSYEEAVNLLEKTLKISLNNFGENHPTIAVNQSNLANVYKDLGRYIDAVNLLEIALKNNLNNFGENHPTVAINQSNLANVYQILGRYTEATELLETVLKNNLNNFGENHPTVASNQSDLANIYQNLGRYEDAANLLEIALKTSLNNFGENHPTVAISQSNLANIYQNLGRYTEAANLLEVALKTSLNNFGKNHPTIATSQSNLANVYQNLGRYTEAANLLETALKNTLSNFGENHPNTSAIQSNLAIVYQNLGRYEEAATLLEIVLENTLNNFGDSHSGAATAKSNLATVYFGLGRYEEATILLKTALKTNRHYFGDNHPKVATTLSNLGYLYLKLHNKNEAKILFEQAYEIFLKSVGATHPNTIKAKENLISTLVIKNDNSDIQNQTNLNMNLGTINISQNHSGSGDNVSGDKFIFNNNTNNDDWKVKAKNLIAENEIEETFSFLKGSILSKNTELVLFQAQYNRLSRDMKLSLMSRADYNRERVKIIYSLLNFIDEL
jgi:tetratricopeptide (TPR) repeat protein